ncbi:hypothetical protein SAMN05444421_109125 [Celeribacter marinus]|uniref:Uncharacterized protein n=2 Tax=Celeribacter marinus TaxID=1397108 RepID=A0A0P0A6A8_9RHOB|nr:hypothetical protein IMCC12053_2236 [Celeribacter marinus]SFK85685.1 hypothetical protein SAMN05444421_109125 [Celeribacter marinus]
MLGLGLDFMTTAARRSTRATVLIDATGPRDAVVFSRASPAFAYGDDGALVLHAPDVARIDHDPQTGALLGTLFEPETTNMLAHAHASVSQWDQNGGSGTDQTLNALGVFTGVSEASTGASYQRLNHPYVALVAGTTYTVSIWLRAGTSPNLRAVFRTSGGHQTNWGGPISALGPLAQGASGMVSGYAQKTLMDGTILLQLVFIPEHTTSYSIGIGPYSAVADEDVVILGMQLEAGSRPSSFVTTSGTPATRAADMAGTTGISGPHRITITYDDDSHDVIPLAPVTDGYWPPLSRPHVKRMTAVAV